MQRVSKAPSNAGDIRIVIDVKRWHLVLLLVAVLVVAIPLVASAATPSFSDVPESDWAFTDVEWLAAGGVTKGCAPNRYCPDDPVTRREMAAFLHRLSGDGADTLISRLDTLDASVTALQSSVYGLEADNSALSARIGLLEADNTTLQSRVAALETQNAALEALLVGVAREGDTLLFSGMNLQIINGLDRSATKNGLGNIIIGYNEDEYDSRTRTGSHYLVIGSEHSWTSWQGIVAGNMNSANSPNASVIGGKFNTAGGTFSTVTGGYGNTASSMYSSVTGGSGNTASGQYAAVTGGSSNLASDHYAAVTGGSGNSATAPSSAVSGGMYNEASAQGNTIIGGDNVTCDPAVVLACGEGSISGGDT